MVNDPIADLIIQLKNASMAKKPSVVLPYSEMKFTIAEILNKEGFLKSVSKKGKKVKKYLEMDLLYKDDKPRIKGVRRISKPGRRVYKKSSELRPVRQGTGLLLLSTPGGVMTNRTARESKVGGEALFEIW
jgi:small subunit ribosomal protein S8